MTRRPAKRPGMVVLATLFVLLMLFLLIAALWNASRVVHSKLEAQNAADAVAQAAGVQFARGLNQLTACNHALGELNARCVLAHAAGGPELEAGGSSGAAIGQARRQLEALLARTAGTDPAVEAAVAAERGILDRLESVARDKLLPVKRACERTLIPELAVHARRIVEQTPRRADAVAAEVAGRYGTTGSIAPAAGSGRRLELPVVPESPADWERSQMVHATTPWVQFWREPTLAFAARHLPLSGYADHFREWSDRYTLELSRAWAARGVVMHVLRDSDAAGKGREPWARPGGGERADELFGVLAAAVRPSAPILGFPVFRHTNPRGVTAYSQVLIYNANPQEPDRDTSPDWQPIVGWDTLNWDAAVRVPELSAGSRPGPLRQRPVVRLNWRVMLVPAARLGEHTPVAAPLTRTH